MTELVASIENLRDKIIQLYRIGQGMATPDRGVRMTIEPFEETRTNEQNDKMWAMLTDVSRQVPWVLNGKEQKLTPEQWKDIFTAALVQETNIAPGINGGFVMLGRRTSRMRKKQFMELIELIYAFGADKSVVWSDQEEVEQLLGGGMKPYRNSRYTAWVKSQPSVISGQPADDPHHLIGHGQGGMGTKSSDLYTIPLTRIEHNELHNIGWKEWESRYGSQWRFVAETLEKAITEGVLK